MTIQGLMDVRIDLDAVLASFLAKIGSLGHLDLLLLVHEVDNRHCPSSTSVVTHVCSLQAAAGDHVRHHSSRRRKILAERMPFLVAGSAGIMCEGLAAMRDASPGDDPCANLTRPPCPMPMS